MIFLSTFLLLAATVPDADPLESAKIWQEKTQEDPDNPQNFFELGRSFYALKEYDRAEINLKHALSMQPDNPDFLVVLGYVYLRQKRPQEALTLFERALKEAPNYPDAKAGVEMAKKELALAQNSVANEEEIFDKLTELEASERYEEILEIWQQLVEQEPNNYFYLYELGRAYAHLEHYAEAIQYFQKSLYLDPGNTDVISSLGYAYLHSGQLDLAEETFHKALTVAPRNTDALEGLRRVQNKRGASQEPALVKQAEEFERQGQFEQAVEIWEHLVQIDPDDAEYAYRLGRALQQAGKAEQAQKYLDHALALNPDPQRKEIVFESESVPEESSVAAKEEAIEEPLSTVQQPKERDLFAEALELQNNDQFEQAIVLWKQLIEEDANNAYAHYMLGRAYYALGHIDQAQKALAKARLLDPTNPDVAVSLGFVYLRQGREKRARQLFTEVLAAVPDYPDARQGMRLLQEREKARTNPQVEQKRELYAEAVALEKQGETARAAEVWRKLLEADPDDFYALYRLGRYYASIGKFEEAEAFYRRSLKIAPDNVDTKLVLGYVLIAKGEYEEAKKLFNEVLAAVPTYTDAKAGLEKIDEAIAYEANKKKPRFTQEQLDEMEPALCYERKRDFDNATAVWETLYHSHEDHPFYAYRLGRAYSLQRKYNKAIPYLEEAAFSDEERGPATARLAANYQALGCREDALQLYQTLVDEFPENTDYLEALARSHRALNHFSEAQEIYTVRFTLGDPHYDLFNQQHLLSKWQDPNTTGAMLYAQERETDIVTRVLSAQRNTTLGFGTFNRALCENVRMTVQIIAGTIREMNLVAGLNNLFIKQQDYSLRGAWVMTPALSLGAGLDYQVGRDIGVPIFPIGHRYRLLPSFNLNYTSPTHTAAFSLLYDTLLIKEFTAVPSKGNLLRRMTLLLQDEQLWLFRNLKVGGEGFLRYYEGDPYNRQWQGALYAQMGFPKYNPLFSLRYWGQAGGFTTNLTDYYSYKRQWQHTLFVLFSKRAPLNMQIDAAFEQAWQWNRKLNQPVNTLVFINKLFRSYERLYFEVKHLYRPHTEMGLKIDSYWDSTKYTTWSVKGSATHVF